MRLYTGTSFCYGSTVSESLLEVASRHVTEGTAIVTRQRALVMQLQAEGRDTDAAEQLLAVFTESLRIFEEHRNSLAGV